jgi:hypothetical protein
MLQRTSCIGVPHSFDETCSTDRRKCCRAFCHISLRLGKHALEHTVLTKSNAVPRTSYALEVRDICNTWMTTIHARQTRQKCASHACVTCYRSSIPRTSQADVVHMMRASCARHSSSKCDVKRAGCALHPAWEVCFLAWVTFGPYDG